VIEVALPRRGATRGQGPGRRQPAGCPPLPEHGPPTWRRYPGDPDESAGGPTYRERLRSDRTALTDAVEEARSAALGAVADRERRAALGGRALRRRAGVAHPARGGCCAPGSRWSRPGFIPGDRGVG
jgi:hypothetical protein